MMKKETFEIKKEFLLNGQPFKIYSGAVHYFRIAPSEWRDTLEKLKAAGLNTVETYIPWNVHEPQEGQFVFEDRYDIGKFVKLAQSIGLYVILRPSPYICAEWEFGGLPAWLLRYPDMVVRSNTPRFMEKVANYYEALFKVLVPLQITHGGPVLMMQVENEYGSFGNDKAYLRHIKSLMETNGVDVPLFTADGSWQQALKAGSLIEDDVFVTANFGSKSRENLAELRQFMLMHHKNWPLMCMEFWDGWFNRWQEEIVTRSADSFQTDLAELVKEQASFNLYMFRGGTNFGFFNGCSSRQNVDYPQITSYDYDAVLHEDGRPSEKYRKLQTILNVKASTLKSIDIGTYSQPNLVNRVNLVDVLDQVGEYKESASPASFEFGSGYGYMFYQTRVAGDNQMEKLQLLDVADRADIYIDHELVASQYQKTLGQPIEASLTPDSLVQILVENAGRVNYGTRLLSPSEQKGIRTGMTVDRHLHFGWEQWAIDLTRLGDLDWQTSANLNYGPTLSRFVFDVDCVHATYLDCSQLGKGMVLLNGINLGHYWQAGPTQALYIPKDFLKLGKNELIVFETTERDVKQVSFTNRQEVKINA